MNIRRLSGRLRVYETHESHKTYKTHETYMLNLTKIKKAYFVGIKGVGMTALAIVAKEMGMKVIGSDIEAEFPTDELLAKYKIPVLKGFKKENLLLPNCYNHNKKPIADLVVVTGAHGGLGNPEALAAKEMELPILTHGEALGVFMAQADKTHETYKTHESHKQKGISVAGSHGKTTTAAMIAHVLTKAGLDPSFAIGCGVVKSLGTSGHAGSGEYFVAEADEYVADPQFDLTPRFLYQKPTIEVFTNIDYDHPDVFSSIEDLKMIFLKFAKKLPKDGLLIAGRDNINARSILPAVKVPVLTYGFSPRASFQISHVSFGEERTFFWAKFQGVDIGEFVLRVPGRHNTENAAASAVLANYLGLSWEKIKEHLATYQGSKRRFEFVGESNGIKLYDDYAHHPEEIKATLQAAREWFSQGGLTVIFQPHTYSRTKALLSEFANCFEKADNVIISDIYASEREKEDSGINAKVLAWETRKYHPRVFYGGGERETVEVIREKREKGEIRKGDIVFTMGAGDIFRWHKNIVKSLK